MLWVVMLHLIINRPSPVTVTWVTMTTARLARMRRRRPVLPTRLILTRVATATTKNMIMMTIAILLRQHL